MKLVGRYLLLLVVISVFASNNFAWNSRGHMIVASVAYHLLQKNDPGEIANILEILKYHPDFPTWESEYQKSKPDIKEAYTKENYIFMRAAIWADDIRSKKHPRHSEHKKTWHFINYPWSKQDVCDPPPSAA